MQSAKIRPQKVVIVDDNNKLEKYKHRKKHNKRKVKVDKTENMERLIITQKVEVKEQKYKCIINLTNICEHKKKHTKNKDQKSSKNESKKSTNNKDKRPERKCETKKPTKNKSKIPTKNKNFETKKPTKNKNKIPTKNKNCKTSGNKDRIVPKCNRLQCTNTSKPIKILQQILQQEACKKSNEPKCDWGSLSPISIFSSEDPSKLLYEDISSDSFCSDEDIDYLIKRTKDRDRKLSLSFEGQLLLKSSMPDLESISDAETVMSRLSGMTTSLHSTTTLVLEPRTELYSPTNPTSPDREVIHYNPVEESKESLRKNVIDNRNIFNTEQTKYSSELDVKPTFASLKTYIKNEPYSPSESPVCYYDEPEKYPYEVPIKTEKTGLVFPNNSETGELISIKEEPVNNLKNIVHNPERNLRGIIVAQDKSRAQLGMSGNSHVFNEHNNVLIKSETFERTQ